MKVSVVIVTYNNEATLRECLRSLQRNNTTEIIVIDNASTDATLRVVRAAGVICQAQRKNLGFAAAANIGARVAQNDYLLFLNPDAQLNEGALQKAIRFSSQHPNIGVLGLALFDRHGKPEHAAYGSRVTPWSLITRHLVPPKIPNEPAHVGWVSAAALVVPRKIFLAVEGFDEQFFLYWEDIDLCRRIREAGFTIVTLPSARVTHSRGHSLTDRNRKTALYDTSADKYFRKYYPTTVWITRSLRRLYRFLSPQVR